MLGGRRRLSEVANPLNYLAIAGNFVGALLGATTGWKDGFIFSFAMGLAYYMVIFMMLYQRFPTNEALPKDLHLIFSLFVATPSVAFVAWERIQGEFDYFSRFSYFIVMQTYTLGLLLNDRQNLCLSTDMQSLESIYCWKWHKQHDINRSWSRARSLFVYSKNNLNFSNKVI